MNNDLLLTGHVSITEKEIEYVNDALINGWDLQAGNYIRLFEAEFAKYVGAKYARSLTGGTQALLMSLAALGIGPGDEVIIPELTYFACSDVVKNLGATPVFIDVLKDTWCIDPERIEAAITPRTKAIMPVWIYGAVPEMDEVMAIAKKHGLHVVEDACPGAGSFYKGKHAGTFGDFGCFSFHAAKIITTGFGGMVVTDNKELYDRLVHLADHGEDKSYPHRFWQTDVGYTFDLPNICCAQGLAQLERIDWFIERKRQIFQWYRERLPFPMNYESKYARSNMVMISAIIPSRDEVMRKLKEKKIDSRPFFYPISVFPMYQEQNTPNAHYLSEHGINLPSGVNRTEEEIDMICKELISLSEAS
jgi:perosamine synthetase